MSFFGSFWKKRNEEGRSGDNQKRTNDVPDKKGNFIGQRYEGYRELGHGGFGVVYIAYSHETKEVYAFKTFKDEFLAEKETTELFRREAQRVGGRGASPVSFAR